MLNIKKAIYEHLTFQFMYDILKLNSKGIKKVYIFENIEDILKILGSDT